MPKAARLGDTAAGHGCMPATPILAGSGDVSINGKPAAREGDMVLLHMCPCPNMPHGIHMRSIKAGSSNVSINGKPATRVDDAIDCGGKVAAGSPDVLIGDTPYQSPAHKCAEGAAKSHAPMLQFEPMLASLAGTFGAGLDFIEQGTQTDTKKTKDTIAKEKNATEPVVKATQCEGDPIDMATGNVVEWRTDFTLSGLAPLIHKRFYHSGQDKMTGLLGHTWRSYWDMCLEVDNGIVTFIDDKGAKAHYPLPADGEEKCAAHMPAWRLMRQAGQLVMRHLDGTYLGFDSEQPIYPVEDEDDDSDINTLAESGTVETLEKHHLSLSHIRDSYGHELCFIYDNGKLERVKLSDNKQQVNVESQDGLITKLILCDENQQPLKTLTRFNYNRAGQLISVRSDAGNNFDYEYDKQDNLLKWSDLGETWVEHTYDEFNRALSTRASNGRWQDQIRYDDDNAIVYYKNPHKGIQCYYRDERNNIVKHIDAKGYVTLSQWQNNQLFSETNALDERTEYVYDDWGQVSSIIAADGSEHVYEYDDNGQLISVTNPLGACWQYEYDTQQNLIKSSDPLGRRWQFEYDKQGQLIRQTQPDGLQTQFSFNENGQMSQVIPPFGHRLRFQYDVLGRLTERSTHLSDPEPSAALNEAASQQTLVRRWHYQHDKLKPSLVVFEDGSEQRFDYDVEGNLIKVVDPLGQVYGYEYGAFDSLMATTDPLGYTTRYLYNGEGQFAGVINSQNHQWRYHYNELGQITEERHFDGRKTQFEYDPLGRVEKRIAPDGAQLLFYYDVLGRLIQKQAQQPQHAANTQHGSNSSVKNNTIGTSNEGLAPEYRITSNTFFEYDEASQLIKATVDDSRRNNINGADQETAAGNKVIVEYEYNLSGQRILERINGQAITSEYDASGERTRIKADSPEPHGNSPEPKGNSPEPTLKAASPYQIELEHQQGLLSGVQISDHQALQFKHNSQGFEISRANSQGFHLAQAWSLGGDLLTQELVTQQLVGHVPEASTTVAETTDPSHQPYYFVPAKPKGAQTLQRHYQYDALARISAIDETHWGSSQFTHNANGQITHQASMPEAATAQSAAPLDSVEPSAALRNKEPSAQSIVVKQFDYDAAQNLIEVNQLTPTDKTVSGGSQQASNNIIDFASKRLEKQLKYQKGGRVETIGEHTYHYDICGRVFEKVTNKKGFRPQVTQYLWDEEDRLIRATLPGGDRWHYQYDAFGRRVAKVKQESKQQSKQAAGKEKSAEKASQINYLWDGNNLIEQQRCYADGTLVDSTQWMYEPESFRPLAQRVQKANSDQSEFAAQLHYIIADHAGTPRELCSETGDVKWRGQQSLWGEFKQFNEQDTPLTRLDSRDEQALFTPESNKQQAANDPVNCDLRYQGQIFDAETGLYYNRHRYYDPDSCQYLSPDPIGIVGGLRPNSYVQNPMEWVDPLGLAPNTCKKIASNIWNQFQKQHKGTFSNTTQTAVAYKDLKLNQSPWPYGYDEKTNVKSMKVGDTFNMIVNNGQEDMPGRFATQDKISNENYGRQKLAIKKEWKPNLDNVVTYKVLKPFDVYEGPVGPQIDGKDYLKGGGSQITFKDQSRGGPWSNARPNEYNDFTDDPYLEIHNIDKLGK